MIAVDDRRIHRLVHPSCWAKSMHDAAWGPCADLRRGKAAWAGRAAVHPADTSQDCSVCPQRKLDRSLADRISHGACGGLTRESDLKASRNILAVGRHGLASAEMPLRVPMGRSHFIRD